ncbi:hypothetical protein [Paenibacillus agricola]|uniref:hypothetical protein n=1 Tax=Paenibacillus agricola TaxID=2716264 RepID=UPI001A9FA743|nr:hypothetical protein [Paenibacillus agricola]
MRLKLDYSERQEFIELNEIEVFMNKLPIRERVYIMNEHLRLSAQAKPCPTSIGECRQAISIEGGSGWRFAMKSVF